jgi:hypothetical protein
VMRIKVGDWVVYKGIKHSSIYRVAEISQWDEAVIYDALDSNKYSRKVQLHRLECANV